MKFLKWLTFMAILLFVGSIFVSAIPEGPTALNTTNSTRRTVSSYMSANAMAGNVTQIMIAGVTSTLNWAGFYGNVTGTLSLESSTGKRMYTWEIANPKGEIYATESQSIPTWGGPQQATTIACWNYTIARCGDTPCFSYAEVEGWDTSTDGAGTAFTAAFPSGHKNIKKAAVDSINNTFTITTDRTFPSFYAGRAFINGTGNSGGCPSIALNNATYNRNFAGSGNLEPTLTDGSVAGGQYQEVILTDTTLNLTIFTAVIDFERQWAGFDGNIWDFQMIVPEKGYGEDTVTTTYNFYVELE